MVSKTLSEVEADIRQKQKIFPIGDSIPIGDIKSPVWNKYPILIGDSGGR